MSVRPAGNTLAGRAAITLAIKTDPVPLSADATGTVRVGGTRVTLDTVVGAFSRGATAEQIVQQYPSLDLADVYAVIAWYLRNAKEVDAYLSARRDEARRLQAEIESKNDPKGIRDRLLARRRRVTT
jgi:uncharacterized protein (DUF433 family)